MSGQCEWCGKPSTTYLCQACFGGEDEPDSERSKVPMKSMWMGQDIDTLPRETLIEIIHYLNQQLESARDATRSIIEINALARQTRLRT